MLYITLIARLFIVDVMEYEDFFSNKNISKCNLS